MLLVQCTKGSSYLSRFLRRFTIQIYALAVSSGASCEIFFFSKLKCGRIGSRHNALLLMCCSYVSPCAAATSMPLGILMWMCLGNITVRVRGLQTMHGRLARSCTARLEWKKSYAKKSIFHIRRVRLQYL